MRNIHSRFELPVFSVCTWPMVQCHDLGDYWIVARWMTRKAALVLQQVMEYRDGLPTFIDFDHKV